MEEDQSEGKEDVLKLSRNGSGWRLMRQYELLKTDADGIMFLFLSLMFCSLTTLLDESNTGWFRKKQHDIRNSLSQKFAEIFCTKFCWFI